MFSQRRWLPRSHLSPALAPSRNGQLSASLSPASTLNPTWSPPLYLRSSSWESRHYTPAGPRCLCSGHSQTSFQSSLGIRIHVLDARPGLSGSCRTVSILSPQLALHGKAEVSQAQGNGGVGKTPGFLSGWVTLSPYPHPHLAWWIEMGSRTERGGGGHPGVPRGNSGEPVAPAEQADISVLPCYILTSRQGSVWRPLHQQINITSPSSAKQSRGAFLLLHVD